MIFKGKDGKPVKFGAGADRLGSVQSGAAETKGINPATLDKFRNFNSLTKDVPLPLDDCFNVLIQEDTHKFEQLDGLCAAHCSLFLCLRLSGLAPAVVIKNMRESEAQFSNDYKKDHVHRLATTIQAAYQRDFIARGRESISQSMAKLLTSTYRKARLRLNARVNTLKQNLILFVKPVGIYNGQLGQFKKSNYITSIGLGGNVVHVDFSSINYRRNASWPLSQSLFQGIDWDAAVTSEELPPARPPLVAPGAAPAVTLRTRLFLLNMRFIGDVAVPSAAGSTTQRARVGHMILVDLSDPESPGVFDPNQGWIAIRQGFCSLQFEQVIYEIWRHYSGWKPVGGKGGIAALAPADQRDRMCDYHITAYQVFQQALAGQ